MAGRAMLSITGRAATQLKNKLAQIYMEAGGLDGIGGTPGALEALKEKLVKACYEAGIGFRMSLAGDYSGEIAFSLNIDEAGKNDEVIEAHGLRIFLDPASAAGAMGRELDYTAEQQGGFLLR